jgi:Skp family chaperone for outer membrane proteins
MTKEKATVNASVPALPKPIKTEAVTLTERVTALKITSDSVYQQSEHEKKALDSLEKKIKAFYAEPKKAAQALHKLLTTREKDDLADVVAAKDLLKQKMSHYFTRKQQAAEAREAERRAKLDKVLKDATEETVIPRSLEIPKENKLAASTTTKQVITYDIEELDIMAVPEQFIIRTLDIRPIKAYLAALDKAGKPLEVPGLAITKRYDIR